MRKITVLGVTFFADVTTNYPACYAHGGGQCGDYRKRQGAIFSCYSLGTMMAGGLPTRGVQETLAR